MNLHDALQARRDLAASGPEREGIDAVVASLGQRPDHSFDGRALRRDLSLPRASMQSWRETLYTVVADGTAITSSSETIMVPDFSLPANYMYVGRTLQYTLLVRQSTAITTPGTITFRLRWGGVAGTSMAASSAFAPDTTAAATNITMAIQWWTVCRSVGTSGTSMTIGAIEWNDYDDTSAATLVANMNMNLAPASGAATATINTTTSNALSPTYQSNVATASSTTHIAVLEALT